ncbi:hypothetical protein N7532_011532 [Penicillium argentinense]|uniref:Phosphoglycerate mutase family protein n=1 Tax=Penicillium argentinense TaxID=1131581 RepID=A0A9W9EIQ0_9EURO|nr:uncharacterized protein N7532_011532 [Penicillium argentinense]KAJ5082489.1 hypothetical protein N7532_011532 [Penicillium argentinense]
MKLYLIRHAEALDPKPWPGKLDPDITNHGMAQIRRLADHFVSTSVQFSTVFSSDLIRVRRTAEGICSRQPAASNGTPAAPNFIPGLREKYLNTLVPGLRGRIRSPLPHGRPSLFLVRPASSRAALILSKSHGPLAVFIIISHWKRAESCVYGSDSCSSSTVKRITSFLYHHIIPLFANYETSRYTITIDCHGSFLQALWECLLDLFGPNRVFIQPEILRRYDGLKCREMPSWPTSGYLELSIQPHPVISQSPQQPHSLSQTPEFTALGQMPPGTTAQTQTFAATCNAPSYKLILRVRNIDHMEHLRGLSS